MMLRSWMVIALCMLVLQGCGTKADPVNHRGTAAGEGGRSATEEGMPVEMPDDFDFSIQYGYGEVNKNEVNTYDDTVTKDLVMRGEATASLTLSEDEMKDIYTRMRALAIMSDKQLVPDQQGCHQTPYQEEHWEVTVEGKTASFTYSDEACEVTKDVQELIELRQYIHQIVAGKQVYKELPESEGGYD